MLRFYESTSSFLVGYLIFFLKKIEDCDYIPELVTLNFLFFFENHGL